MSPQYIPGGLRAGGGWYQEVEGHVWQPFRLEGDRCPRPCRPFVSVPAKQPTANTTAETNTALIASWEQLCDKLLSLEKYSGAGQGRTLSNQKACL